MCFLFRNQILIFDTKINLIVEKVLFKHDMFLKVKLFSKYVLLVDLDNNLTINEIKNDAIFEIDKIEMPN